MRKISLFLILTLTVSLLAGCAGTPVVYYTECTCPVGSHDATVAPETEAVQETTAETEAPVTAALKTGLAISATVADSKSAVDGDAGEGKYDVTVAAVLVDDNGVIQACIIDGIAASIPFDAAGTIVTDLTQVPLTKTELGENYGMVKWGNAIAEWDAQVGALADFAVGKTVEELKNGALDETGKAPAGSDLATSATIYLGGCVSVIEKAVANAAHLGAQTGDTLKLAVIGGMGSSASADAENPGNAQLNVDVAAVTVQGETITSAVIDAVQAKVAFDAAGTVTSDVSAPVKTKNELGENYGLVKWGNAIAEWNAQAAAFAAYTVGKTPAEVAGIAVTETIKPAEADLASSVTIAIGGFQALIAKACGQ